MPDYKSMYYKLYGIHCDVMEMLQKVTQETEEMAMDAIDPVAFPEPLRQEEPPEDTEKVPTE